MRLLFVLLSVSMACGCKAAEQPTVVAKANDPFLKHHEIRPEQLPAPYATRSANNGAVALSTGPVQLHVPPGFSAAIWAKDLNNPRNLALAPNGDVFVAETAAGRVRVFRDANGDGVPERVFTFAENLDEPFGLVFTPNALFVGNTDAVVRFDYKPGQTSAAAAPKKVLDLPARGHSTRNLALAPDGKTLYVAIGSQTNVSVESDPRRAAILEANLDGSNARVFASGLRNPVGLAWNPATHALWTSVNERDGLGDDLVPDFITEVKRGAFYGWPYSYIGANVDPRRKGERPDLVAKAIVPSVLIQAHSAPLGVAFYSGSMFPQPYRGGAFVALHGSWNRSERTGYKVIHVPFRNGVPAGGYDDFMVGWSTDATSRRVAGRPVGLLVMRDGSLLVADDGANVIYRVTYGKS